MRACKSKYFNAKVLTIHELLNKMLTKFPQASSLLEKLFKLRHEMAWILTGQALCFVGGFIGIKVLTNILGPKGYGQLALGLTIAGLFNQFVYGPLSNVVARFYSVYRERGSLVVYFYVIKRTHKLLAVILTVLSIVAGLIGWLLAGSEWGVLIAIALLFGVVSGVNASYVSLQSAIRDRKVVALHQGADVWCRIGLSTIFLYLFQNTGYVALVGYLLGTLLVTMSQHFFLLRKSLLNNGLFDQFDEVSSSSKCYKEFSTYAMSFVVFAGFSTVSMYADRWVLQILHGESAVGIYTAIYQIAAAPVNILFALVNQLMVPIIFERAGNMTSIEQSDNSGQLVRATVIVSSSIVLILTVLTYSFGAPLIRLLTNATFVAHHSMLWVTVLGLSLFNIGQLFALRGISYNRPNVYILPKGVQAISFLLMAYFGGRLYGLMGVAGALCGSSLLYVIAVLAVNSRLRVEIIPIPNQRWIQGGEE